MSDLTLPPLPEHAVPVLDLLKTNFNQAYTKDEIADVTKLRRSEITDALGELMVRNQIRLVKKKIPTFRTATELVWAMIDVDDRNRKRVETKRAAGKVVEIDEDTVHLHHFGSDRGFFIIPKRRIMRKRIVSVVTSINLKHYYAWKRIRRR